MRLFIHNRPRVSIIVPVRDEAAWIEAGLAPLQVWRRAGHELIVVDGDSRDASVALAQPWADRVVRSAAGRARQMHAGAEAARGEVLLFLHVDTQLPAAAISLVQHALADGEWVWGRFDARLSGRGYTLRLVERMMNWRSRWSGIATGDQAMFMWHWAYFAVGGFPQQNLMEDISLSRRLLDLSRPACLRPAVVTSSRRWEQRGVWRTVWLMWRLRLAYALGADPAHLERIYYD